MHVQREIGVSKPKVKMKEAKISSIKYYKCHWHPIYVGFAHKVVKQIVGVDTFIIIIHNNNNSKKKKKNNNNNKLQKQ